MTEINTFSALVSDIVKRSGRPDRVNDIVAYARSTIRECQVKAFFRNDLIEDTLTTDADVFIWSYPQEFRILRTVRYPISNLRGERVYPPERGPGKSQRGLEYFYYGGPGYYAFAGLSSGSLIDVAYYKNSKKLAYHPTVSTRPATFSLETDSWSYLTATSDAEKLIARELVSNWLLFNYYDTIAEGTLNKVLKTVGDQRASAAFALYKSLQKDLVANEPSDSLNK